MVTAPFVAVQLQTNKVSAGFGSSSSPEEQINVLFLFFSVALPISHPPLRDNAD